MKYDSYPRFLKSDIYKDCIRKEMEGKAISYSKNNEEKPNNLLCKLKDEEKKDKRRSPFLPWTKGKSDSMHYKDITSKLMEAMNINRISFKRYNHNNDIFFFYSFFQMETTDEFKYVLNI